MMKTDMISSTKNAVLREQQHASGMSMLTVGANLMIVVTAVRYSYFIFLAVIPLLLMDWYVRKYIVAPRIGYAQMQVAMKARLSHWYFLTAIAIIVGLGFAAALKMNELSSASMQIWGGVMITVVLLIMLVWSISFLPRSNIVLLVDYGILMLAFALTFFIKLPNNATYIMVLVWGTANIIIGFIRFIRFIITYPVVNDEE